MTKTEVAEVLNCSTRQVEKYASEGRLTVVYVRGKRGRQAKYDRAEVEKLQAELEAERETVIGQPPGIIPQQLATRPPVAFEQAMALLAQPLDLIVARLQAMNGSSTPPAPSVWLTIDEAAAWLGLPRKAIERALHDDRDGAGQQRTIKAIGRGGGLRLHAESMRAHFES